MSISFSCKNCGKRLKAPESAAGKTSKCPQCGKPVTCPEPVYDAEPIEDQADSPEILDDIDPYSDLDDGKPYALPGRADSEESGEGRRPCPMCGEMIFTSALKCRFCGEVFDKGLKQAETKKKKKKRRSSRTYSSDDEDLSDAEIAMGLLCSTVACVMGIIWMIQGKPKGGKMIALIAIANLVVTAIFFAIGLFSANEQQQQPDVQVQPPPQFQFQPPNIQPQPRIQFQPPNMPAPPNFQPPNFPPPNMPAPPNFQPPRFRGRRNF